MNFIFIIIANLSLLYKQLKSTKKQHNAYIIDQLYFIFIFICIFLKKKIMKTYLLQVN